MSDDRECLSGLASMRRPQTASELMQFLQARNWLRTSLPRLAEVVQPLRVLLEEHSTPDQANRVKSGDGGGSMDARAGGCVE